MTSFTETSRNGQILVKLSAKNGIVQAFFPLKSAKYDRFLPEADLLRKRSLKMSADSHKKVYILVANGSEARCYATTQLGHEMSLVKEYQHPESRQKGQDLVSDGPGHYRTSGSSHGAFVAHSTSHEQEVERFAHELAEDLRLACHSQDHYKHLVIVAPAHFYGMLNKHCDVQVRARIAHHLDKDYTKLPKKDLQSCLDKLSKPA